MIKEGDVICCTRLVRCTDSPYSDVTYPLWGIATTNTSESSTQVDWVGVDRYDLVSYLYASQGDVFRVAWPDEWPDEVCTHVAKRRLIGGEV